MNSDERIQVAQGMLESSIKHVISGLHASSLAKLRCGGLGSPCVDDFQLVTIARMITPMVDWTYLTERCDDAEIAKMIDQHLEWRGYICEEGDDA